MSLINEALKKAQRQRHDDAAVGLGQPGADGRVAKRAQPKSATSMLLLVAGGLVLVAISIVATAMWLTRPATPAIASAKPAAPAKSPPADSQAPVVIVPMINPATLSTPTPKTEEPPKANPPAENKPAVPVATAVPAKTDVPAVAAKPDERIHKFVEALRVTGIRSSGTESKVLMNDRVYRVNDIVDRTLGVRLTKVESDNLTFTDENGATYVKYF